MSPTQLELILAQEGDAWQVLRRLLRECVDFMGLKEAAYLLDVSGSSLRHALDGRERHHVRAEWLIPLIRKAPDDSIPRLLAKLRGLELAHPEPITADDELRALRQVLDEELGPRVRAALSERASARATSNRPPKPRR